MSRELVLSLLRDRPGEYVSGEQMSQILGISRAAVWKAIEGLRQEGYEVSSVRNRGYCLEFSPDCLREWEMAGALKDCRLGNRLLCLEQIDSTNTECKRQALTGAPEGLAVLAQEQTAGRGRAGRSFQSPKDAGLYLSVLMRPALELAQVSDMTAWVAVAVCDAVEAVCGVRPQIKWTNDLILNGKKLCGILTELGLESESHRLDYLVTGVGINVNHGKEDFDGDVRDIATSLALELGHPVRRVDLAVSVLRELDRMYQRFPENKQEYLEKYRKDCITLGKQVQLITPVSRREARAVEIDDQFRLVVELPDGSREALSTGEVSVRGMYGYI